MSALRDDDPSIEDDSLNSMPRSLSEILPEALRMLFPVGRLGFDERVEDNED